MGLQNKSCLCSLLNSYDYSTPTVQQQLKSHDSSDKDLLSNLSQSSTSAHVCSEVFNDTLSVNCSPTSVSNEERLKNVYWKHTQLFLNHPRKNHFFLAVPRPDREDPHFLTWLQCQSVDS